MSYADHRPALRISSLPVSKVDILSTGAVWLCCPSCSRWVCTRKRAIVAHRAADEITRCRASGRKVEVDVPAEEHRRRRAVAIAETNQRRAVYSNVRAHREPRMPVAAPLAARSGEPRPAQVWGWPQQHAELVNPERTWNTNCRAPRPA